MGFLSNDHDGQKWEYKKVHANLSNRKLNKLGAKGWELVHFLEEDGYVGATYIFKRKVGSSGS